MVAYMLAVARKQRRASGARLATRRTGKEKIGLDKSAAVWVFRKMGRGGKSERRKPLAGAAKPLKKLKTAMGGYWKKLAWIWVWRHVRLGLAPRRLGVDGSVLERTLYGGEAIEAWG
jgi:hypothetical protein